MASEAVKMEKPIDLSFEINKEGLTGKDLLTTLMRELNKQGYFLAGVIVSKNLEDGILVIGHQSKEIPNWPIKAMEYGIEKFNNAAATSVERVGGKES